VSPAKRSNTSLPKLQDTVRLSADGLAKILGDLEARVLRAIWELDRPATARDVHEVVVAEHEVSPLTTITVLNRLVAKRVLRRAKFGDRLHFSARMSESEFMAHASRRVVEGVLAFDADAVASSFIDVLAERDPAQLEQLADLIRRRLQDRPGSDP
jgi:predicted transcriptional regulator